MTINYIKGKSMRLDNFIQTAMNNVLKNPVLSVLRDINFSSILKQSNFIKRDIGKSPYLIILLNFRR